LLSPNNTYILSAELNFCLLARSLLEIASLFDAELPSTFALRNAPETQRGSGSERPFELEARVTFRALRAPNYSGFPSVTEYPSTLFPPLRQAHAEFDPAVTSGRAGDNKERAEQRDGRDGRDVRYRAILTLDPAYLAACSSLLPFARLSSARCFPHPGSSNVGEIENSHRARNFPLRRLAQLNGDIMRDGDSIKSRESCSQKRTENLCGDGGGVNG